MRGARSKKNEKEKNEKKKEREREEKERKKKRENKKKKRSQKKQLWVCTKKVITHDITSGLIDGGPRTETQKHVHKNLHVYCLFFCLS